MTIQRNIEYGQKKKKRKKEEYFVNQRAGKVQHPAKTEPGETLIDF